MRNATDRNTISQAKALPSGLGRAPAGPRRTSWLSTFRSNSPASETIFPSGEMMEEMPVLAARTTQRLVSTARNTAI